MAGGGAYLYLRRYVKNIDYAVLGACLYTFSGFTVYNEMCIRDSNKTPFARSFCKACTVLGDGSLLPSWSRVPVSYTHLIYIGPLFESGSHGYDTIDYRLVDRRLRSEEHHV